MIVATSGHIDHGKTSLVRALTGIDADRLPEEKRRGLTIDLGFAYAPLPDGSVLGFVDVPGHERFLHNMLAGVLSIDCVLLIVAADDGPMPQTLEHLAILDLIGVSRLTAVVTKIDRVEPARVAAVTAEIDALLRRSGFAESPILAVSSHTGEGVAALRTHLEEIANLAQPRSREGGFRLAVDRSFVLPGVGVVVTGTVAAGQVAIDDRLVVTPRRLAARVRSIHAENRPAERALVGERCALGIAGPQIDKAQVQRGDWLVAEPLHAPVQRFDARMRTLAEGEALKHGMPVHVHLGTADIIGRITVLGQREIAPASEGYVHIALDRPTAALFGDRVVVRDHAARRTLAGGHVVDPFPPARGRAQASRLAALAAMDRADPAAALTGLLALQGYVDLRRFGLSRNLAGEATAGLCDRLSVARIGRATAPIAVSPDFQETLRRALLTALADWHAANPDAVGPRKEALMRAAARGVPADAFEAALFDLMSEGRVVREGAALRLPDHRPQLGAADEALWSKVSPLLSAAGLRPPRIREIAEMLAMAPEAVEQYLTRIERFGRVVRVSRNRFFLPAGIADLAAVAAALAAESEGGTFTAAAFNQRSGTGRNLTIEILEFLDKIGVTRREGEARQVIRQADEVFA